MMGPAATGKTLLQRYLILFFYYYPGYNVLAVAPANDNVNKLAKGLHETLQWFQARQAKDASFKRYMFDFLRLFPRSRDLVAEDVDENEAKDRKVGHNEGEVLSFSEYLIALERRGKEKFAHREHGVAETIIKLADGKVRKAFKAIGRSTSVRIGSKENAYGVPREFMDKYRQGKAQWTNNVAIGKYKAAYLTFKARLIETNRIMITTTGNVRAREMLDHWCNNISDSRVPSKGVIVIGDEGPKDVKPNGWAPIACEKWSHLVEGVAFRRRSIVWR